MVDFALRKEAWRELSSSLQIPQGYDLAVYKATEHIRMRTTVPVEGAMNV